MKTIDLCQRSLLGLFLHSFAALSLAGGVNTAPVLHGASPSLLNVFEDDAPPGLGDGTPVSHLVDFPSPPSGVNNVTDPDAGALLGIAIVATDNANGSWSYTTDNGLTWFPVGAVSGSAALLLAADASTRVCFHSDPDVNGYFPTALAFRAWDQTSGVAAQIADTTTNGGSSAYSSAFDWAQLIVISVSDAPVLDPSKSPSLLAVAKDPGLPAGAVGTPINRLVDLASPAGQLDNVIDPDFEALTGLAVIDVTGAFWWFSTNGGMSWHSLGPVSPTNARLLAADADTRLYFMPEEGDSGTRTMLFRAWDRTTGVNGGLAIATFNGSSGAFSDATDNATILIGADNSAPTSAAPASVGTSEDDALFFVDGDTLSVGDVDTTSFGVTLSATGGVLNLGSSSLLGFSQGDGSDDALMSFFGSQTELNFALATLNFAPTPDFHGQATLDFIANDGYAAPTPKQIQITIAPVIDIIDDDVTTVLNTMIAFNAITGSNGASADNFEGTPQLIGVTQGVYGSVTFQPDGVVVYTPNPGYIGADAINYTVNSGGANEAGLVSMTVTLPIGIFLNGFE